MPIHNVERFAAAVCLGLVSIGWTHGAEAGQSVPAETSAAEVALIDAPVPPVAPATINRDEEGRATLRAVRLDQPLTLDGNLRSE